jgi:hypothetical protein
MWSYQNMPKSRTVLPKPNKGGRPATGRDPVTAIRLSKEFRTAVDTWVAKQADKPGRSEAIRRLVELGLRVKAPAKPVNKPGRRLRAQELAAKTIENMIDPSTTPDERDRRRRRLTKGPPEFREDRGDLPKAKR